MSYMDTTIHLRHDWGEGKKSMGHTVPDVICPFCETLCKSSFCNCISSLGPGYKCNVTKFPFNPETDTDDPEKIDHEFGNANFLIKSGEIVGPKGEVSSNGSKQTYWVLRKTNENPLVERDIAEKFRRHYIIAQNNDTVAGAHYLPNKTVIGVIMHGSSNQ